MNEDGERYTDAEIERIEREMDCVLQAPYFGKQNVFREGLEAICQLRAERDAALVAQRTEEILKDAAIASAQRLEVERDALRVENERLRKRYCEDGECLQGEATPPVGCSDESCEGRRCMHGFCQHCGMAHELDEEDP